MIAAAGSGERLGAGGPKAFVELAGRPLLAHSLAAIERAERIGAVVIAAPAGWLERADEALAAHPGLSGAVVEGAASRAGSVRAALERVGTDLVVVHDAARPLASPELFDAIVDLLAEESAAVAAIAAAPLRDTVKRSRSPHAGGGAGHAPGEVVETVARDDLWAAQTPQGFRTSALRAAQARAKAAGELGRATDEALLLEGVERVLLVPAPAHNLKVTTPGDLGLAAALLAARGRV